MEELVQSIFAIMCPKNSKKEVRFVGYGELFAIEILLCFGFCFFFSISTFPVLQPSRQINTLILVGAGSAVM